MIIITTVLAAEMVLLIVLVVKQHHVKYTQKKHTQSTAMFMRSAIR